MLPHAIGRQTLDVEVATDAQAAQLLDRVGELNRARLLPTIERVLDEFGGANLVRVDRIDLEIGTIPADRLDLAAERLETALRDVLSRILMNAGSASGSAAALDAPDGTALVGLLLRYLRDGVWPYQSGSGEAGDPATLLAALVDHQPAALVESLRRHGAHPELAVRLGRQMPVAVLARLLHRLDPEQAAAMVASIAGLRRTHGAAASLSDSSFARSVWPLVLRDVLSKAAGAASDLVAFERRLHADIAEFSGAGEAPSAEGYGDPSPIALLAPAPIDLLEQFLLRGLWHDTKPEALLLLLAGDDPGALARLFRRHAWNDAVLRRVTEVISVAALGHLLTVLEPDAAAPILDYMIGIRALHRAEPIVPLSDPALERLLWHIALRYALRETGSQFNRRSFVATLIDDVAREERLSYRDVLAALRLGVIEMAKAHPVATSLPAIIDDLAAELESAPPVADALLRLDELIEGEERIPADILRQIIETAQRHDRPALRRFLQRHAGRDPGRLLRRLGTALSTATLINLLLPADDAGDVVPLVMRLRDAPAGNGIPALRLDIAIVAALARARRAADEQRLVMDIVQSVADVIGATPAELAASLETSPDDANQRRSLGFDLSDAFMGPAPSPEMRTDAIDIDGVAARYARLDQFRHLLRTGALPWRDCLAEPSLTKGSLLDSLERMRQGLLRAAFVGPSSWQFLPGSALARLSESELERVTRLLLPDVAATRELSVAIAGHAAKVTERRAFRARVIAALIEGHTLDLEAFAAAASTTAAAPDLDSLLGLLAEGIGQRDIDPVNWRTLLARLLEQDARVARRFLAAVAARPAGLARLGELCGGDLARVLGAVAPAAASTLAALSRSLAAHGTSAGPSPHAIAAAILAEALTIEPDAAAGVALVVRVLRRLFGDALPASLASGLRGAAAAAAAGAAAAAAAAAAAIEPVSAPRRDDSLPRGEPTEDRDPLPAAESASRQRHGGPRQTTETEAPAQAGSAHAEWLFRVLAQRDLSRASPGMEVPELLAELLGQLVEAPGTALAMRLVAFLHRARNRADLVRLLPERLLARLIMHAVPQAGRDLLEAGELLAEAAAVADNPLDRATLWQALLATAAAPVGERTVFRLTRHVFTALGRSESGASSATRHASHETLLREAARHARDAGHAALVTALDEGRDALATAFAGGQAPPLARKARGSDRAKAPAPASRTRTAFRLGGDDDAFKREPIYIGNAGLVLANPFLPRLFDVLGIMATGESGRPRLRDEEAASRAVHLLQYLVDGRTDQPETLLVLNKLLCGLPLAAPIVREIDPTDAERETCDTLLRSMIDGWPIVHGTSIDGLRETFLQRDGKLSYGDVGWQLQVQRKTLDVLVDQLPWSMGVVFHAWMPGPLHVTW